VSAIDWTAVVGWAPQLSVVGLQAQTDILNFVNVEWNPDVFGGEDAPKLRQVRLNHAAHEGTMVLRRGIGGALTSETIAAESVSLSYAAPWHGAIDAFETTSYSQELLKLIMTSARTRFVVPRR